MADRDRFQQLYDQHYRSVLAYCLRRLGPLDAHAAANEVMEVAWRRLDDVPADDGVRPWLYGVARNVVSHHWRATRRWRRLEDELRRGGVDISPGPEQVVVMRAELDQVLEAVGRLSERDQEMLRLAGWEGLSHREIAEIFGCSIAAVDQRFHRAKRRLAAQDESVAHDGGVRRLAGPDAGGGPR